MDVGTHWVTWGAVVAGAFPYVPSCLAHYFIEHFVRWWLGVIDVPVQTKVSPRSDVQVNRAGKLAFCFAEDGTSVILVMGAVVHAGRDATQRAWLSDVFLYQRQ